MLLSSYLPGLLGTAMPRGGGAADGGVTTQRHGGGRGGRRVGGQAVLHLCGEKKACHHWEDVFYDGKL